MAVNSLAKLEQLKQIQCRSHYGFQRKLHVTDFLISRIGLEAELEGHNGCVNCIEWNERGDRLISGSDDVNVILWDPFRHKKLQTLQTGHYGNIFSVKFLPSTDNTIITGAADSRIRMHDLVACETTHVWSCHSGRVKRIATSPNVPHMFWSASEDGLIMQFDTRCPDRSSKVLINLLIHMGENAEAKCIAVNPTFPELIAYPSDYSGMNNWARVNFAKDRFLDSNKEQGMIPKSSVKYCVAGHLPLKLKEYKEKHRSLASTYLTFSPDGSELLVNLGGEQIYLFNVGESTYPKIFSTELFKKHTKNGTTNGFTSNGVAKHIGTLKPDLHESKKFKKSLTENEALPPLVEKIKSRANDAFNRKEYTVAISLYNEALQRMPHAAILYSNRAAALLKRQWDGDVYSAMNDCHSALKYNSNHIKAHFRLIRCLYELNRIQEADLCLKLFKSKFPDQADIHSCINLDVDINRKLSEFEQSITHSQTAINSQLSCYEKDWRENANDYHSRFCGHCNTTTDIKEVNFFGSNGQYIVAGSDDGSFFVWDKKTSNIKRIMKGDDSIVNCLQPHPSYCLLASSGIDPVVRLWSPKPEDGSKNDRDVKDLELAAKDNQRRMNADPLEVMLMNMGYRFHPSDPDDLQGDSAETDVDRCRQS
ncbi:WD and tetratricopeptide repeats protein 1 [Nymphon striatum]|nr:WD and tetratricopeptide repeats protein 1 [Nymphon striatum]